MKAERAHQAAELAPPRAIRFSDLGLTHTQVARLAEALATSPGSYELWRGRS